MALKEPHDPYLTAGFVEVGSDATVDDSDNAIRLGKLRGEVTAHGASVIQDYEGDNHSTGTPATATCRYRVSGIGASWRDALDPRHSRTPNLVNSEYMRAMVTTIPNLMPNTIYDVEVTVTDPDASPSVVTQSTTFTTDRIPNLPSGGVITPVANTSELSTALSGAVPGERIQMTGTGAFISPALNAGVFDQGTRKHPVVLERAAGATCTIDQLSFKQTGNAELFAWIHNVEYTSRIHSQEADDNHDVISTQCESLENGTEKPVQLIGRRYLILDGHFGRDASRGDVLEHSGSTQNNCIAFCKLTKANDPFSRGGGLGDRVWSGNNDWLFTESDDFTDDWLEFDGVVIPARVFGCVAQGGRRGVSQQQQLAPWQLVSRCQWTGGDPAPLGTVYGYFKEFGLVLMWHLGCTIVQANSTNGKGSYDNLLGDGGDNVGSYGTAGGGRGVLWMNMLCTDREDPNDHFIVNAPGASSAIFGLPAAGGGRVSNNAYGVDSGNPIESWTGLTGLQDEGVETDSIVLDQADLPTETTNWPADQEVGTLEQIHAAAGGQLDATGTDQNVTGFLSVSGPWSGSKPPMGMGDPQIRFHTGPREFTDHAGNEAKQLYAVPSGWAKRDIATATDSQYTALGLPSSLNSGRILLDKDGPTSPTIACVIDFQLYAAGTTRWTAYENWLTGSHLTSPTIVDRWYEGGSKGHLRDGLGVTRLTVGSNTLMLAAVHENGGLALMTWGMATSSVTDALLQDAWQIASSLYNNYMQLEAGEMPSADSSLMPSAA